MPPSWTRALNEKVVDRRGQRAAADAGAEERRVRLARQLAEALVEHVLEQPFDQRCGGSRQAGHGLRAAVCAPAEPTTV